MTPTPPAPTPTPTKTVSAAQVVKDIGTYGGIIIAIVSVLANVPAFHSVFAASAGIQAVVDALVTVITGIFSAVNQTEVALAYDLGSHDAKVNK